MVWFGFFDASSWCGLHSRVLEYSVCLIRKRMLMVCSNMVCSNVFGLGGRYMTGFCLVVFCFFVFVFLRFLPTCVCA